MFHLHFIYILSTFHLGVYKNVSCELRACFCEEETVTKDDGAAKLCPRVPLLVWVCLFTLLNHLCRFNHLHVLPFLPKELGLQYLCCFPWYTHTWNKSVTTCFFLLFQWDGTWNRVLRMHCEFVPCILHMLAFFFFWCITAWWKT
jgi:hypothetical protein